MSAAEIAKVLKAHQFRVGTRKEPPEIICKAKCHVPMLAGELFSDTEARHQSEMLAAAVSLEEAGET